MKMILTALITIQMIVPLQIFAEASDKVVRGILVSTPNQIIVQGIPVIRSASPIYQPVPQTITQNVVVSTPAVVYRQTSYEKEDSEAEAFGTILGLTALFAILTAPFCHYHYFHQGFHHGR